MAIKKYTDAEGNVYELDDEKSLVAGHPDLKVPVVESTADPRFVPARPFHQPPPPKKTEDWRTKKAAPPAGYTNPVDDPEYLKKIQFNPKEKP
jgi:hypothetical protein